MDRDGDFYALASDGGVVVREARCIFDGRTSGVAGQLPFAFSFRSLAARVLVEINASALHIA